ncbi:MAG: GTPase Era [Bacteroidetes bacterium GWA2_31_9]|nr:MAG: GTPase Era [Bacteroidetes bacterium GWA2_31_9]
MNHKAGFVNIIGNPNVGKSTLMNVLVGEKVSIITHKSQTTRHRILGIVNDENFQIVFSDTPGIIKPHYKMQESMMGFVRSALEDADVLLYVTDIKETIDKNSEYFEKITSSEVPVIVIINKIDLSNEDEVKALVAEFEIIFPKATIVPLSALLNKNMKELIDLIVSKMPESPAYYPKDQLTDKPEKFFVSEIIREKILKNYKKEIPYSVEIEIEEYTEDDKLIKIRAIIYVIRDSQKGIIIGNKGLALKKTGTEARKDMEEFLQKKVFLEMYVKVKKDWRDNPKMLKDFGY